MADGPEEGGGADVPHGDRHYTGLARIESFHRPLDTTLESTLSDRRLDEEISRRITSNIDQGVDRLTNFQSNVDRLSSGIDRLTAGVDNSNTDILSLQPMGIASGLDLALSGFGDREKAIGVAPGLETGGERDRQMGVSTEIDREKTMMRGEDVIMKQENDQSATCLEQQMVPINLKSEVSDLIDFIFDKRIIQESELNVKKYLLIIY